MRDLYNNIADGNFPTWSLKLQVMTYEEAEKFRWNPFDLTKVSYMDKELWIQSKLNTVERIEIVVRRGKSHGLLKLVSEQPL